MQSLLLVNSATLRQRGRAFAARLEKAAPNDAAARVRLAYQLAFGRVATDEEVTSALAFLESQQRHADSERLASGQAAFVPEKVPYRDGQAAHIEPDSAQSMFRVTESKAMLLDGAFTIEAFVVPRTVSEEADLRTIAAKWNGDKNGAGWTLGITGQRSRRKPLTIALQLIGDQQNGQHGEHPVFSDLGVRMNKPYYIAAAITPATATEPGRVFFALKDLSNDDEPLLTATVEHSVMGGWQNELPLTLAARSGGRPQSFHGVIDDVRVSSTALPQAKLLYTAEAVSDTTLGYWRFEAKPDVFADASGNGHALEKPAPKRAEGTSPEQAALTDFCQALLNASEFLYVE